MGHRRVGEDEIAPQAFTCEVAHFLHKTQQTHELASLKTYFPHVFFIRWLSLAIFLGLMWLEHYLGQVAEAEGEVAEAEGETTEGGAAVGHQRW